MASVLDEDDERADLFFVVRSPAETSRRLDSAELRGDWVDHGGIRGSGQLTYLMRRVKYYFT